MEDIPNTKVYIIFFNYDKIFFERSWNYMDNSLDNNTIMNESNFYFLPSCFINDGYINVDDVVFEYAKSHLNIVLKNEDIEDKISYPRIENKRAYYDIYYIINGNGKNICPIETDCESYGWYDPYDISQSLLPITQFFLDICYDKIIKR